MSRVLAVIPARMGSSRFPGKPLALLGDRPLVQHVYERTARCPLLDRVVVATCDEVIAEAARSFGATAVMTSAAHERASERVAEVSAADGADLVVMIQGDEPMVRPEMISAVLAPLQTDPSVACVNLCAPITSEQELLDPNTIKVVVAASGHALYFSRSPIPYKGARPFDLGWSKQVCVIAFRRDALARFAALPQGPLEIAESIDMLRFLENGIPVRMVPTDVQTHAVDTPDDLLRVTALLYGSSASATEQSSA